MKTAEYYVKVKIESEADLPKGEHDYFVQYKNITEERGNETFIGNKEYWLRFIDWYLLPQQIELPSDEEIEKAAIIGMQREEGDIIVIIDSPYASAFCDGAKWAIKWIKDRIK